MCGIFLADFCFSLCVSEATRLKKSNIYDTHVLCKNSTFLFCVVQISKYDQFENYYYSFQFYRRMRHDRRHNGKLKWFFLRFVFQFWQCVRTDARILSASQRLHTNTRPIASVIYFFSRFTYIYYRMKWDRIFSVNDRMAAISNYGTAFFCTPPQKHWTELWIFTFSTKKKKRKETISSVVTCAKYRISNSVGSLEFFNWIKKNAVSAWILTFFS